MRLAQLACKRPSSAWTLGRTHVPHHQQCKPSLQSNLYVLGAHKYAICAWQHYPDEHLRGVALSLSQLPSGLPVCGHLREQACLADKHEQPAVVAAAAR